MEQGSVPRSLSLERTKPATTAVTSNSTRAERYCLILSHRVYVPESFVLYCPDVISPLMNCIFSDASGLVYAIPSLMGNGCE